MNYFWLLVICWCLASLVNKEIGITLHLADNDATIMLPLLEEQ